MDDSAPTRVQKTSFKTEKMTPRKRFYFFTSRWLSIGLVALMTGGGFGGEIHKATLSCIQSRPIAMGGAFMSVRDDLAALDFNPANFSLGNPPEKGGFSVFLNPLGPLLIIKNHDELKTWASPIAYVFRGIGFSWRRIDAGLLFGEEPVTGAARSVRTGWFAGNGFQADSRSSIGLSLALAPRVSLGAAGEIYVRDGSWRKARFGYRYGLRVAPRDNLSIGICYFDFPKTYEMERLIIDRIDDATLNVGISFSPFSWLEAALDVRNVSDDGKAVVREPHFGLEVKPVRHVSIQSGYYRIRSEKKDVFSFGLGLLDQRSWFRSNQQSAPSRCVLHASWVVEKNRLGRATWFFLTCTIKI
jgi:hypothetical protein